MPCIPRCCPTLVPLQPATGRRRSYGRIPCHTRDRRDWWAIGREVIIIGGFLGRKSNGNGLLSTDGPGVNRVTPKPVFGADADTVHVLRLM